MDDEKPNGGQSRFRDGMQFFMSLFSTPHLTGAVAPSSPALGRAMAMASGPPEDGVVIELGPGTGPVTRALLDRGLGASRLVMVEYNPQFCRMLEARFPGVRVVEGDAYDLPGALSGLAGSPISAFVSSLPLLARPAADRLKLLDDAFAFMGRDGVFVQFTYGPMSPIPREAVRGRYTVSRDRAVWTNLPPARVWTYRREPSQGKRTAHRPEAAT